MWYLIKQYEAHEFQMYVEMDEKKFFLVRG